MHTNRTTARPDGASIVSEVVQTEAYIDQLQRNAFELGRDYERAQLNDRLLELATLILDLTGPRS